MAIKLIFTLLFLSTLTSSADPNPPTLKWWCKHTPHPRACLKYLSQHTPARPPTHLSDFYKLSLQVAYNLTLHAQSHLVTLSSKSRSRKVRKATLDCTRLHAYTLIQLNRTLSTTPRSHASTSVDHQSWLSAALTNLRTCRRSFSDLKASYRIIAPIYKHYNVTELISNCLAINRPRNITVAYPTNTSVIIQASAAAAVRTDFTVSKGRNSRYRTVQAAVNAADFKRLNGYRRRMVIYVRAGVYNEIVTVPSTLTDLTMIGDGMGKTVITGSRSVARGYTTFSSPTFSVFGDRFICRGITFRNTYGPGSQAVALLSGSDQSVFYKCGFEGYQDTLCVYTQRQFYRECDIYGTIDFIFGNAAVVIQNSNIIVRLPRHGESNVITAQGRTDPNQNTGIVIQFSRIRASTELWAAKQSVKSFLGRPWMLYSRTVYMQNTMDDIIHPLGWMPFTGEFALKTLYYAEYKNSGAGSRMRLRVKWRGFHVIAKASVVRRFTVANFIAGGDWLPATRVPFTLGF